MTGFATEQPHQARSHQASDRHEDVTGTRPGEEDINFHGSVRPEVHEGGGEEREEVRRPRQSLCMHYWLHFPQKIPCVCSFHAYLKHSYFMYDDCLKFFTSFLANVLLIIKVEFALVMNHLYSADRTLAFSFAGYTCRGTRCTIQRRRPALLYHQEIRDAAVPHVSKGTLAKVHEDGALPKCVFFVIV